MTLPRPVLSVSAVVLLLSGCGGASPRAVGEGTVEVHEANLGPPVPATVLRMLVDEGDEVRAGDTLALLLQRDLDATIALRRAELGSARATLRDLEAGARSQELRRAEADLAVAEAEVVRTTQERDRLQSLASTNATSRQSLDDAVARHRAAVARRDAVRETLTLLDAGTRPDQITAARARVAAAEAAVNSALARESDLVLLAPFDGRVLTRMAEPGEVLGAGVPAVTIGEVDRPWVRAWFPATVIASLTVGDSATIELPTGSLRARVASIAPQAEFTPRVALTEEERADLLFGVKVEPVEEARTLHPGLWVRVRLFVTREGSRP